MELKNYIREIENFPKEGIGYKDISPLLLDHKAMKEVVVNFIDKLPDVKIDKVVGMESRGFFFASLLAQELKAGFVPVRKPGK
ncbi:adenine phosphoribosyltransferase, partial [Christiangramia sp. ASW11-125]